MILKIKLEKNSEKHIVIHSPFLNWIKENNPEINEEKSYFGRIR